MYRQDVTLLSNDYFIDNNRRRFHLTEREIFFSKTLTRRAIFNYLFPLRPKMLSVIHLEKNYRIENNPKLSSLNPS